MADEHLEVSQQCEEGGTVFYLSVDGDWSGPDEIFNITIHDELTGQAVWWDTRTGKGFWNSRPLPNSNYIIAVTGDLSGITRSTMRTADCAPSDGGGPTHPADGTFIRNQCYGFNLHQVVADGLGGERQGPLVMENSTECGYVPEVPPVLGCTNPLATNYNPLATQEDNSCLFAEAVYYPVGGVLPNPITYTIPAEPLLEGQPKKNHFITATLYRMNSTTIGSMRARVRDGVAVFDVSSYLRPLVKTGMPELTETVTVAEGAVVGFYLAYREEYTGKVVPVGADGNPLPEPEQIINNPRRFAVEAAMDGLNETFEDYVLR